jgi:predicted nucleic-acid-binding Zn-ribbon protein
MRKHRVHRKPVYESLYAEEVVKTSGITCTQCGSTNIYDEVTVAHEWIGSREVKREQVTHTCVDCGHTWIY